MPTVADTLPFERAKAHKHGSDISKCPMFKTLPKGLQDEAKQHLHLGEYLHLLPIEKTGIPEYYETLERSMGDMEDPNLIYPVGEGIFVHILPNRADARNFYIAIEPGMTEDVSNLMNQVEIRLGDFVGDLTGDEDESMRTEELLGTMAKVTDRHRGNDKELKKLAKNGNGTNDTSKKVPVTRRQYEAMRYLMVRDKVGMGPLQPLIQDPFIEDISCSGVGGLYMEHKIFKGLTASIRFNTDEELDTFVIRLSEKIGKPVTYREPIVDATLPDGSRINIVFGKEVSKQGSNFTIRKFTTTPISVIQLINFNTMSYEIAAYLSLCLSHGMNLFVSGETASGKTTTMNAITTFIPPTAKIVSIEDTPELQVPHPNWIRETVRGSQKGEGVSSAVTMFDLLKAALRQRPNEIIIGEIRGEEGAICFQAMQTGHAAMATFHAASVEKLIQRLTGSPISIPKTYIDNLNVCLIQSAVRLPSGKDGRRVISINEIVGYDSFTDSFSFIEVFRWNPVEDTFEFTGYMNSYLLEEKIAMARGLPPHRKRNIYNELTRRANILRRLQQQGVEDFHALYQVLSQAYREGVLR